MGDSKVRKTDTRLSKGEDVVVCLPGARIEHVTEGVETIMGRGNGGSILVHVGTNNADKEGTTAIVEKYRNLLKKTKQAMVGQIILSGILPVFGNRIQRYRNSKRMAVNGMVKRLCKEEEVGYVDLWDSFVGKEEMYMRDGLHLSGKGAAIFAEGLSIRRQRRNKRTIGSSDHNQMHFNIHIKSDKTKVKQWRRDFRKGNYKEIRKKLALIDCNVKMKIKTATECWNILRRELDSEIDSYVPMKKQGKRSKKKHLSKEAFRKIIHKQHMWRFYKYTGRDKDYDAYKDALNAATNEVRKSKRNFEHKLAQI